MHAVSILPSLHCKQKLEMHSGEEMKNNTVFRRLAKEALLALEGQKPPTIYLRITGDCDFELSILPNGATAKPEGQGWHRIPKNQAAKTLLSALLVNSSPPHLGRQIARQKKKDALVRKLTPLSKWRGPFLEGGAPGLGRR